MERESKLKDCRKIELISETSCAHGMRGPCLECDCLRLAQTIFELGLNTKDVIKALSRYVDIINKKHWDNMIVSMKRDQQQGSVMKDLEELSPQTIKELVALVSRFDCGAEISVNNDDNNIEIRGVDLLNDQGNINVSRTYDFDYGLDDNNDWHDTSKEMMETIKEDDIVLGRAGLYEVFEETREEIENE